MNSIMNNDSSFRAPIWTPPENSPFNLKALEEVNTEADKNKNIFLCSVKQTSENKKTALVAKDAAFVGNFKPFLRNGGNWVGSRIGQTYASGALNVLIGAIYDFCLGKEAVRELTWSEKIQSYFTQAAKAGGKAGVLMGLTPILSPMLISALGTSGALAVPFIAILVEKGVRQIFTRGEEADFKPAVVPVVDHMIKPDTQLTGLLHDNLGRLITDQDKEHVIKILSRLDFTNKLLLLLKPPKEKKADGKIENHLLEGVLVDENPIETLVKSYLIYRQDGLVFFKDGRQVKPEELEKIQKGIDRLKQGTLCDFSEQTKEFVSLICDHNVVPLQPISFADKMHEYLLPYQDKKMTRHMPPLFDGISSKGNDRSWKNFIIQCEDGKYCLSEAGFGGRFKGIVIPEEKMKKILAKAQAKYNEMQEERYQIALRMIQEGKFNEDLVSYIYPLDKKDVERLFKNATVPLEGKDDLRMWLNGKMISAREYQEINKCFSLPSSSGLGADPGLRLKKVVAIVDVLAKNKLTFSKRYSETWKNEIIHCLENKNYYTLDGIPVSKGVINEIEKQLMAIEKETPIAIEQTKKKVQLVKGNIEAELKAIMMETAKRQTAELKVIHDDAAKLCKAVSEAEFEEWIKEFVILPMSPKRELELIIPGGEGGSIKLIG